MASSPIFVGTPKNGAAAGVTTVTTVYTAGASGARIDRIMFQTAAGATGGPVTVYVDVGGTDYILEIVTKSASATWSGESTLVTPTKPLILGAGNKIEVAITGGDSIDILTSGGDY